MSLRLAVLASGRGSNLRALLEANLGHARVEVVLSNEPDAGALTAAQDHGVETVVVEHRGQSREAFDAALVQRLEERSIDWVVLAGFMRIVGPRMLEAFGGRIINIHPSLLPAFPGLKAQRQALEAGVRVSGCTVHLVDAGMDTGPILAQAAVAVFNDDDEESLAQRILQEEHTLLPKVVRAIAQGRTDGVELKLRLKDEAKNQDALVVPGGLT